MSLKSFRALSLLRGRGFSRLTSTKIVAKEQMLSYLNQRSKVSFRAGNGSRISRCSAASVNKTP